jgi:ABC-type phosphate transport system substrate-binding protein
MSRLRLFLPAGLLLAAALTVGFGPAPAGASGPTITGSGSSYAAVALDQWVAQVGQLNGDNINYSTSSSVIGLNEFAQQQVDFGASEIGYSTNQANSQPPAGYAYQYLPDVAGATCIMFNAQSQVTGQQISTLQLTTPLLMGIFTGTITKWGQLAQGGLNAQLSGDQSPIVTVFRTDPSGENYILSDYLNTLDPTDWAKFNAVLHFPGGPQAIWPFPQSGGSHPGYDFSSWNGESGSDNASEYVASNPGSITYVETAYAQLHHEPCAYIQNLPGAQFVQPSAYNDAVALLQAQLLPDLEQQLTGVYTDTQPNAYPISAYSYLVAQEGQFDPAKGAVLGRFIQYFACQGQVSAEQLGYSPLPPNLVNDDFQAITRIAGAAPPPTTVNASTCKDPYVALFGGSVPQSQVNGPGGPAGTGAGGAGTTQTTAGAAAAAALAKGKGGKAGGPGGTGHGGTLGPGGSAGGPGGAARGDGGVALAQAVDAALTRPSSGPPLYWLLGLLALLAVPPLLFWRHRKKKEAAT